MARVVMLEALAFGLEWLSAAARRLDVELVLMTFDRPYYRWLEHDDSIRVVDVDTFDPDAVRRALDALGRVDGLVSNTDLWAPTAELLAEERGFPGVLRDTARLRDKVWVRNRVVDAGLSRGRATRGDAWPTLAAAERPEMAVVKDASGTGSRDVALAERPEGVDGAIADLVARGVPAERITVEPYARGALYSAETYTTSSGTVLFGVNSRTMSELPDFRELDLCFPVGRGGRWETRIAEWVTGILESVGRGVGPSHVEFVDTEHGPELVEVNSRLGGGLIGEGIVVAGGTDPYELLLLQALEPRLEEQHVKGAAREPTARGFGQVIKYTHRLGPLGEILGVDQVRRFPGDVAWHPSMTAVSSVTSLTDQRASYGFLTATGPSPHAALARAHAAARHLRPAPRPTDSPGGPG